MSDTDVASINSSDLCAQASSIQSEDTQKKCMEDSTTNSIHEVALHDNQEEDTKEEKDTRSTSEEKTATSEPITPITTPPSTPTKKLAAGKDKEEELIGMTYEGERKLPPPPPPPNSPSTTFFEPGIIGGSGCLGTTAFRYSLLRGLRSLLGLMSAIIMLN